MLLTFRYLSLQQNCNEFGFVLVYLVSATVQYTVYCSEKAAPAPPADILTNQLLKLYQHIFDSTRLFLYSYVPTVENLINKLLKLNLL